MKILLCLLLPVVLCNIDEWRPVFKENFVTMDTNKNGVVDLSEYSAIFLGSDTSGDGKITLDEYLKDEPLDENKAVLTADFHHFDNNKDGVVDMKDLQHDFDHIDSNDDNLIEQDEFVVYAENLYKIQGHPAFGK